MLGCLQGNQCNSNFYAYSKLETKARKKEKGPGKKKNLFIVKLNVKGLL